MLGSKMNNIFICLKTFPLETIMFVLDFVENITFIDFNDCTRDALALFSFNNIYPHLLQLES